MMSANRPALVLLIVLGIVGSCYSQSDDYDVLFDKKSSVISRSYSDQISTSRVKLYWKTPVKIIYKCSSRESGWSKPLYLPPNLKRGYIDFSKKGCGAESKRIDIIIKYNEEIHHKELNISGGKKYAIRVEGRNISFDEIYSKEDL